MSLIKYLFPCKKVLWMIKIYFIKDLVIYLLCDSLFYFVFPFVVYSNRVIIQNFLLRENPKCMCLNRNKKYLKKIPNVIYISTFSSIIFSRLIILFKGLMNFLYVKISFNAKRDIFVWCGFYSKDDVIENNF